MAPGASPVSVAEPVDEVGLRNKENKKQPFDFIFCYRGAKH
jgi:hypothetical protein